MPLELKNELEKTLKANDKPQAVRQVVEALEDGLDVVTLYSDVLAPILNGIYCEEDDFECVWLEHQITSITRTLIETSYPYVLKQKRREDNGRHVLVVCPKDEYHELGAVIGTHFFELEGFQTTYIGANTPLETIDGALRVLKPDYLAISVSNAYHLFEVNKIINHVERHYPDLALVGAGRGFSLHETRITNRLARIVEHYEDVVALAREEDV